MMENVKHFAWVIIGGCKQFLISLNHSIISHRNTLDISRVFCCHVIREAPSQFNKKPWAWILSLGGDETQKKEENIESYEQLLYRNIWNSTDSDCCRHQSHLRWALCEHRKGRKREKMNCHKSPPSFHSIFFLLLLFTLLPAITHSSFPMFNASPLLRFFLPSHTHIRFGCLVHKRNEMPW